MTQDHTTVLSLTIGQFSIQSKQMLKSSPKMLKGVTEDESSKCLTFSLRVAVTSCNTKGSVKFVTEFTPDVGNSPLRSYFCHSALVKSWLGRVPSSLL